jgi:protease-4
MLMMSVLFNITLYSSYEDYLNVSPPIERYHSGDREADARIAIIGVEGTIMPPFTERILKMIEKAKKDDNIKGVLLAVDSPGGLVADSHQIYHALQELREKKPIFVSMKRIAASGGVYVAMGAGNDGRIFAEPTTWTGSIGVIIPRFNATALSEKIGIESEPLMTGEFKDALSPFRKLSDSERQIWEVILDDSFERFIGVIADNRKTLDHEQVKALATGQVYTADQAMKNGLIDEIGYEEDAITALKKQLGLEKVRIVTYKPQQGLMELLTGSVEAKQPENTWQALLEATVPRAMYYCSWAPAIPNR